ncbi:hypothetical protein D4R20_01915 [bacterium]|nr:MAG: hypothetical protein D4R20_01915 [bacterium]
MLDKIKSLSKDTLIYGTSTIVGRFLNFLLVPVYTNLFLPGEFGVVANIYAYIAILNVFLSIGLESGYFKFASTLEVGSEKENFSHPFIGIFLNSFFISAILFLFSKDLSFLFQVDPSKDYLIKYTALILFFDAIVLVPFAYLRLQHKAKQFATIRVISIVLNVIFNIILIVVLKQGIEAVFISNLIASAVTFAVLLPIILKNLKISFNRKLWSELLRFSLPYIPAGISSNIVQVINRPILTALTNDSTVGIYQANYRLGIFMMLFVSMFDFAWRPFFLQNAKEPNAREIYSKVMTIFVIAASFIFLALTLFIENIATFKLPFKGYLIGKAYWGGLEIVPLILLGYLFYGMYINLMAGIYIEKKTKYLPYITGLAAVVNIIANFLLIPVLNMKGSAIATALSYFIMLAGIYYASQKHYYIKYEFKKLGLIFLSLAFCYFIFVISSQDYGYWFVKLFVLLVFTSSVFFLGVVDFKSVRKLIKH